VGGEFVIRRRSVFETIRDNAAAKRTEQAQQERVALRRQSIPLDSSCPARQTLQRPSES
jgi:hypothetical protein